MKFNDILSDASSNMLRNKARSILTIVAIFIGAFTLTITNGIGAGVSDYIDKQLGNIGAEDVLLVQAKTEDVIGNGPQKYDPERSGQSGGFGPLVSWLNEKDLQEIKEVPGIVSAEPMRMISVDYIEGSSKERYAINLVPFIAGTNLVLAQGNSLDNTTSRNEIVLPNDYPAVLGYGAPGDIVGEQVILGVTSAAGQNAQVRASVVGILEESLTSIGGASINESLASALYDIQSEGQPESVKNQFLAVQTRVNKDISESELTEIKSTLDTKGYRAETIEDRIGAFKQVIDAIVVVLNVFAGITLLAASFGIVNTLLMAVQERTKEIGLMKAMGLQKGKIFLLFSVEAVLLGFWGSLLGSLAGIGVGQIANRVASDTFLKDLPGFNLTAFSPQTVAIIMLLIMTIAFIAGTLPARRASQKDPIDALRYE